jgi:hypothetical protein
MKKTNPNPEELIAPCGMNSKVPGFGNSIAAIMCSVGPAAIIYEKTVISHFGVNR